MRIWVTGSNGLLGKALIQALRKRGVPHAGSTKEQADVTQLSSLSQFCRQFGPFTHIVNCAAYTSVDLAETHQQEAQRLNGLAPALLALFAVNTGLRLLHLSTDYVFNGTSSRPYREEDPIAPQTIYGHTKAEGERRLLALCPQACVLRTSWLFGSEKKNFVTSLLHLMKEQEELKIVSDQIGRPTYAPDLASVILEALNWSGVYHIANRGETSWYSFAKTIHQEALAKGVVMRCQRILPIPSTEWNAPAKRPAYSVLDTSRTESLLKQPLRSWKEGLCALLNDS